MKSSLSLVLCLLALFSQVATAAPDSIAVGPNPESVVRGFDGDLFVTLMGETRTEGDGNGRIVRVRGDTVTDFATGLDDPKGLVFTGSELITADFKRVWKIDAAGNKRLLAGPEAFPHPPAYLNDVALAPDGQSVFITDMGPVGHMRDPNGKLWPLDSAEAKAIPVTARVYRVTLDGKVSVAIDKNPAMLLPNGVSAPTAGTLLVAEFFTGNLLEWKDGSFRTLAEGHRSADGILRGRDGTIYTSEVFTGNVYAIKPDGTKQQLGALQSAADFCLDENSGHLVVPDTKAGKLVFLPLSSRP